MSSGNFDEQSASRISRAVRYVEGGWPVGTKRARRPPLPDAGGTLQIVRLIENIPPAKLHAVTDDFYERFSREIGSRVVNEIEQSELLRIGSEIINAYGDDPNTTSSDTFVDRFFSSGLAWLCEFEPGRNREALEQGQVSNILVRFTEVVRVWNMHSRGYNTNDIGGAFGNEAGGLGGGFCNAIRGWDSELWLVQPDRRVLIMEASETKDSLDSLDANMTAIIEWLELVDPNWRLA